MSEYITTGGEDGAWIDNEGEIVKLNIGLSVPIEFRAAWPFSWSITSVLI